MEVPQCLDSYVNDYQMHVFEVAWLTEEEIQASLTTRASLGITTGCVPRMKKE